MRYVCHNILKMPKVSDMVILEKFINKHIKGKK